MPSSSTVKGLRQGWSSGETGWGPELNENMLQIDNWILEQWGQKRSTTTGLTYGYKGGVIVSATVIARTADSTVLLTASQVNYVERTSGGVVSANIVGFSTDKIPMAVVTTNSSAVTAVADYRAFLFFAAGGKLIVLNGAEITGSLKMLTAVSKLIAGATSFAIRDAADAVSFLTIDAATSAVVMVGALTAVSFSGVGTGLTALDAGALTTGLVNPVRINGQSLILASLVTTGNVEVGAHLLVNGQGTIALVDLTNIIGAVTIDFNNGNNQKATLTGNVVLTLSGPITGSVYMLQLKQDGTGGRTVTWPASVLWPDGLAPTLSGANKVDIISMFYDGTNYRAQIAGANYA